MRADLRVKAILVTGLLSVALLGMGVEFGWLLASRQVDEANNLTTQATDKVLALTQEKQALEQRLQGIAQRPILDDRLGEVWRQGKDFYGLARLEQKVIFNRELTVELLATSKEQAELSLSWQGQRANIVLRSGGQVELATHWCLVLQCLGDGWVVMLLRTQN